jgi:flagellar biosynthetic protein FlhB
MWSTIGQNMGKYRSYPRIVGETGGKDFIIAHLSADVAAFAVALKYEAGSMGAPRVVAKGADLLAFRIRDAANGAKVPVLRAPPLARALYAHAEIDREVPAALFAAVAQVLAHVYQLRAHLLGGASMPPPLADLPVPVELDPLSAQAEHE